MTVTIRTLAAIWRICKYLFNADGSVTDDELVPVIDFLKSFSEMTDAIFDQIARDSEEMTDEEAVRLLNQLDEPAKQQLANLFFEIVCADGELHEREKALYVMVSEACNLPNPCPECSEEEEPAESAESADDDDEVVPGFIIIRFDGITSIRQSTQEEWTALEAELAGWIGGKRVEIVRFTKPLNALTERLNLNKRHLVFMLPRGGTGTAGDNMPASLLYGGGYPIFGNIAIALETDDEYDIEGITSRKLMGEALDAINAAVDGLLRCE